MSSLDRLFDADRESHSMTGAEWGAIVRKWATKRRMSLTEVSHAMGRATDDITQILNGQRGREADPRLSVMRRVAAALGCTVKVVFMPIEKSK